ncbi:hypothetical protein FD723_15970 [Nostoc sp. C052]|nr:hypothetical protein FD723_15970 [Nostoc sp. C052]
MLISNFIVIGHWSLVISHWSLVICYLLLAICQCLKSQAAKKHGYSLVHCGRSLLTFKTSCSISKSC